MLSAMNSNSERPEVARITSNEQEGLCSFPDCILCHILSFLPTKYAAMTSLLSKRWRYLFLGVPKIDLNEFLLLKPQEKQGSGMHENRHFIDFVNRRLMLCRTSSITEFRLECRELPEWAVINLWFTALLFRNIKVLEVEQLKSSDESSPRCPLSRFFLSENLMVLKLCRINVVLKIPESVSFPNLKVLNASCMEIQFESDNFSLTEGYPLLEDLRLDYITFLNKDNDPIKQLSAFSDDSSTPCPLSGIFWSKTLVVLELWEVDGVLKIPESVCFPNLQVLELGALEVQFESDDFSLVKGFPLLEDLSLEHITFQNHSDNDPILRISIHTLKMLSLAIYSYEFRFSQIYVDTPHLQHFTCKFDWASPQMQINCCKFESLVSAHIYRSGRIDEEIVREIGEWVSKFLSQLTNVKDLNLTNHPKIFRGNANPLPEFPNLTKLTFDGAKESMWILIERTPNLKVLLFDMRNYRGESLPEENVPHCVAQTLQIIKLIHFCGHSDEFEIVRFFLERGAVLERLIIQCDLSNESWAFSVSKQILKLRRLSPKCEVELVAKIDWLR